MLPILPIAMFFSPLDVQDWPREPVEIQAKAPLLCLAPAPDMLRVAMVQSPAKAARFQVAPVLRVGFPDREGKTDSAFTGIVPQALWRADDGLFYVDAMINGASVRLVVDTGASMIVLTAADAKRVGISPDSADFTQTADTAAGKSSMAHVTLAQMRVGQTAAASVPAVVAREGLGTSLLGQNWLSRVGSVTIEGDRMILR